MRSRKPEKGSGRLDELNLSYTVLSEPAEIHVSEGAMADYVVDLFVGVRNPHDSPVPLTKLLLTLRSGTAQDDLTDSVQSVTSASSRPSAWSIARSLSNESRFEVRPVDGAQLAPGEGVLFSLLGIEVNERSGVTPLVIEERIEREDAARAAVPLSKTPSPLTIRSFQTLRPIITAGEAAVISWRTLGASHVEIVPAGSEPSGSPLNGSVEVRPLQTTTYTLTVTGKGPNQSRQLTVTVQALPVSGRRNSSRGRR